MVDPRFDRRSILQLNYLIFIIVKVDTTNPSSLATTWQPTSALSSVPISMSISEPASSPTDESLSETTKDQSSTQSFITTFNSPDAGTVAAVFPIRSPNVARISFGF